MACKKRAFILVVEVCTLFLLSCSASCKKDAVGLADGYIEDSQLSASSELNVSTPAKNGRLNYTAGSSWCAFTSDSNPYLQIDLRTLHIICAVSTQGNSQGDQWVETYTLRSSTNGKTWTDYKEDGQVKKFRGNFNRNLAVKQILFSGIVGRYLRFVVGDKKGGVCLRVEVFGEPRCNGNIALFKPTLQSSTEGSLKSSRAVDGVKTTHYSKCTHTKNSTNPWWRVDLGRVEPVAVVNILNRGDCCGTRLDGAEIRVDLALNQSASQKSTAYGAIASRAVDGNPNNQWSGGSCTHTDPETDPWWRVDLGSPLSVAEVVIVNRNCSGLCGDRLKTFEIRIGNSQLNGGQSNPSCGGTHSLAKGKTKPFYCAPRLLGQFVYVLIPGNGKVLTICELEVYTTKQSMNDVNGCANDPVGVSDSANILDQRFSASSSRSGKKPSDGRLKGASAWIPSSNSNNNDYLQIDLGSVYFVCGVATQGNPAADDWTKTYKIETSLDNANWKLYSKDGAVKTFNGNSDRNSIIRSELYQPLAAKFIRFYPASYHNNKALRVEVYGSWQGCLSSVGNERSVTRDLGIVASSQLDNTHTASYNRLYGIASWCSSSSVSLPQYLQFDFKSVVTVTGVATQGDAVNDKWVKSFTISCGYDKQRWISYGAGKQLTGNSDKNTVFVNWFSKPFAAQYVKIFPTLYNNGICMRVDLFICKDFQVPYIFVNQLKDIQLTANPGASVTLDCTAKFSQQRPPTYKWSKGATVFPGSDSSLTIAYKSATNTHKNYYCVRMDPSAREVQCNSTYQCTASLPGMQVTDGKEVNVSVVLKVPGPPTVSSGNIKARSASITWSYSPGLDELSVDQYTLQYQNRSFNDTIPISGGLSIKDLMNLKPYTSYSVRMMGKSSLGEGLWSGLVNFITKTAVPEDTPILTNVTAVTSQTIYIEWQGPRPDKVNGPLRQYIVSYKEAGVNARFLTTPGSSNSYTLVNLKKWTDYIFQLRVSNGDFEGPWSAERRARTKQDAPSSPKNLHLKVQGPNGNSRPQLTVTWMKPDTANGIITMYKLLYSFTLEGKLTSHQHNLSNNVFSFNFNVLGGVRYTVRLCAETVKPGQEAIESMLVPTYKPSIPPQGITSQRIHQTIYNIAWLPLSREKSHGKITAYEVKSSAFPKQCTRAAVSNLLDELNNVTETTHNFVLSNLRPCTKYEIKVRAYTVAGPSEFSSLPIPIDTSVPLVPTGLSASSPQSTSLILKWKEPSLNSELVEKYQILFNGTKTYFKDFKDSRVFDTSGPVLTYKVDNLLAGTKYTFAVRAKSLCGIGDMGNSVVVETMRDYPRSPSVPVVKKISTQNTSMSVTIWGVEPYNGPISHYQVIVQRVNNWADEIPEKNKRKLLDYDESQGEKQGFYIAAELQSELVHSSLTFDIGDGKNYGTYKNVALAKSQKYKIYIRAVTTAPKFLPGRESLTAMVTIMEEDQETKADPYTGDKPTNTVLVISNIILGVLLASSLGMHAYFWRVRRTPKTGEKYSPKEIQVDAPQNEQGDAGIQASQQTSGYIELRPTQAQLTSNTTAAYHSLTRNREQNTESGEEYANADFDQFPEANEDQIYENMNI